MKTRVLFAMLALLGVTTFRAVAQPQITTLITNGLNEPFGLSADSGNNIYVADRSNHRIVVIDGQTYQINLIAGATGIAGATNSTGTKSRFNGPKGVLLATVQGVSGLLVADTGNHAIRFVNLSVPTRPVTTIAGGLAQPGFVDATSGADARFSSPIGMTLHASGILHVADSGNNVIRQIDLTDADFPVTTLTLDNSTLFQPNAVAAIDNTHLWIADTRNHAIKLVEFAGTDGTVTMTIGSNDPSNSGTADSEDIAVARFSSPRGLLWLNTGGLLVSDTGNHSIRLAKTNNIDSYRVTTFAGSSGNSGSIDGVVAVARFAFPEGMARDNLGGLLIADRANSRIRRYQLFAPLPPLQRPRIGRIERFVDTESGIVTYEMLDLDTTEPQENDFLLGIESIEGAEIYYTAGPTPPVGEEDLIPDPTRLNGGTPPEYEDPQVGEPDNLLPSLPRSPFMTVKARAFGADRLPSEVDIANLIFRVANPIIVGNAAASFQVFNNTTNATMWYTTDGSDPVEGQGDPVVSGQRLSLEFGASDTITFKVQGYRANYTSSGVVTFVFSRTNFDANRISFGFESGEASSQFVAAPGQRFYAPVTLSLLQTESVSMHGLQFAAVAANSAGSPALAPGTVHFESTLLVQLPTAPPTFRIMDPSFFTGNAIEIVALPDDGGFITNIIQTFTNGIATNSTSNLISVVWMERLTKTNLYSTLIQDLITFSQPLNTRFLSTEKKVVVGGFSFVVPAAAPLGSTYDIQLIRPSATFEVDQDVYIDTPTNGSLGFGAINSIKKVTLGIRKYLVGDPMPFRWYNAGDFGDTNLLNNDLMQVFQSVVYGLNSPPEQTDIYDSLDSSNLDSPAVFDGDDTTINAMALGDGVLGVDDIFVTFRRATDPTLTNWVRSWVGGVRTAEMYSGSVGRDGQPNLPAEELVVVQPNLPAEELSAAQPRGIAFIAGDVVGTAGQTVTVPITIRIKGGTRGVIALNLNVKPLDGAPEVTTPISFNPSLLGIPENEHSANSANYAAWWRLQNWTLAEGSHTLGTLTFTIPQGASATAAYAIEFEHASSFISQKRTSKRHGIVSTTSRQNSTAGDGIPDLWRLRNFGTASGLTSLPQADSDGDGVSNWAEFKAGTNPNDATSRLHMANTAGNGAYTLTFPTGLGVRYVVECSTSLFGSNWVVISPIIEGTGLEYQFSDANAGSGLRFYRIRVVE